MEGDGKCRAEAEARGLPMNRNAWIEETYKEKGANSERKSWQTESYLVLQMEEMDEVINER